MTWHPRTRRGSLALATLAWATLALGSWPAAQTAPSTAPDTPFKLATFEAAGQTRVGLVLGTHVLDISGASAHLAERAGVAAMTMPTDMRALIEQYPRVSPRLYQIANYFKGGPPAGLPFVFDLGAVSIKAPIKYPWNLLAAAANYRAHAEGMGAAGAGQPPASTSSGAPPTGSGAAAPPARPGGFNAAAIALIDPDRDAPVFFAKSPRSCIIDPGEPYYIPAGRDRIDWEGEMAIIIGREAYMVPKERAHDHVFGYSIMYDVSDRGGRRREASMFPGANWFEGKSTDRGAPFGPFIVPKEFLPNHDRLRIVTRVNGVVKQDGSTKELLWKEEHMIAYLTSILTLYPGDVISSGTPAGTGAERQEFLKPGDVVTIEIEGIGTLTTPMKSAAERPPAATSQP